MLFIKKYLYAIYSAIAIAVLVYIKYLKYSNEAKKEKIQKLKKDVYIVKEIAKHKEKKAVFEKNDLTINNEVLQKLNKDLPNEPKKYKNISISNFSFSI